MQTKFMATEYCHIMHIIDQAVQLDIKLAVRMSNRFFARATALKWHFHVLRGMQHLTWQSKQGLVRNT